MYYADKEDAYIMKHFFVEEEKTKVSDKILKLTDDVKWDDIVNTFEEVDANGEEKLDVPNTNEDEEEKEKDKAADNAEEKGDKKKKKKKKNK